ncbi:MAG TPA: hypothetical protein VGF55_34240 [Gemmataceae bacterium]|jgi:hypothetical protein
MRRTLLGAGVILVGVCAAMAADKDTQLAANTRARKLTAKVSVDFKDEMLDECIKEISRQLEDQKLGSLSPDYALGVSRNQRVTYSANDRTVADVLDGLLKKNGLGYYVVSKDKDRYDSWIRITRGNERGWPAGQEPKDKATAKAPKAAPEAKDKPAADPDRDEKAAANKLDFARSLLKDGKTDRAKQRLQEIVTQYPNTKAAGEAKKELEKLGK